MDVPTERKLPAKLRGRFWLPTDATIVLAGELTISAPHHFDVIADVPHESLGSVGYWEGLQGITIPVIFGTTEDGKRLTLGECGLSSSRTRYDRTNSATWQTLKFYANRVLIGAHIDDFKTARFKSFSAYFAGFSPWVCDYSPGLFDDPPTTDKGPKRSDNIDHLGQLSIAWAGATHNNFGDVGEKRIIRYWRPVFIPTEPLTFGGVTDVIITFQRLLCVLIGRPIAFDDIQATPVYQSFRVELMAMMGGYMETFEHTRGVDMLLSLPQANDSWSSIVSTWFAAYSKLAPALNLYFAVVFGRHLFDEHKFLFLAQALEGYHRCKQNGPDDLFSSREWKARRNVVIDSAPPAEREWLREELRYAPKSRLRSDCPN